MSTASILPAGRTMRPNGFVLYSGPSQIDGRPIVAIVTGTRDGSANRKTGAMWQVWILSQAAKPTAAFAMGEDTSVCGTCYHRGERTESGETLRPRTCYVNLGQGPNSVYAAWERGRYPSMEEYLENPVNPTAAHGCRFGAYGDPYAVPLEVWRAFRARFSFDVQTAYSHQWRIAPREYAEFCMASADTEREVAAANAAGWRAFYVAPHGGGSVRGAVHCPSDPAGTVHISCAECGQCNGTAGRYRRNVYIGAHGPAKRFVGLAMAR